MANCILYQYGSNEITYFIRNCQKMKGSHPDGWNYIGNVKIQGIKSKHFSEFWTEDIPIQDEKGNWDKKVSDLAPALTYKSQVVSNRGDVDTITKKEIRKQYSLEDELKLQRQRDILPNEFKIYYDFVENLRAEARAFKNKYFMEGK